MRGCWGYANQTVAIGYEVSPNKSPRGSDPGAASTAAVAGPSPPTRTTLKLYPPGRGMCSVSLDLQGNPHTCSAQAGSVMITLGVILLIVGFLIKIPILWTIGIIVLIIGLVLLALGSMGRAVGGRRHYY